eukprot:CAMPEP_0203815792 /NCGR_PEP_ID=MMETSP0115-20131106/12112_1 /ASSEMBLY_ACC=CAM_ASM_000227 /TAXON_ID=33651 /ORGANISM="Bicosoecid sp, Strain ms1" /LENGTH=70 /DNA_ID=CAMNT_0050724691 /DNA_START=210 /DNA_END=422 /DNA_ORIENTATION=-
MPPKSIEDRGAKRSVTRTQSSFVRLKEGVEAYFGDANAAARTQHVNLARNVAIFVTAIFVFQRYGSKLAV